MTTRGFVVSEPFDGEYGDIILRSRDRINFLVYKGVMLAASPIFRDMFSLPDSPVVNVYEGSKPVIDMEEPAVTLDYLLRFCYPVENPRISDKTVFRNVVGAAQKFEMESLYNMIVESHITNATVSPMEQYGLAHRFRLSRLAKDSARRCLDYTLVELVDQTQDADLTHLSLSDYNRLFQYHRKYTKECQEYLDCPDFAWLHGYEYTFMSNVCGEHHAAEPDVELILLGEYGYEDTVVPRKKWWFDHLVRIRQSIEVRGPIKAAEEIDLQPATNDVIASGCQVCQRAAIGDLHKFSTSLVAAFRFQKKQAEIDLDF